MLGWEIEAGSCNGAKAGEIAADEDAFSMPDTIVGITWDLVLRQGAEKDISGDAGSRLLTAGNLEGHRPVDTHQTSSCNGIEQDGDIAMTDQPFRVLQKAFFRDAVQ